MIAKDIMNKKIAIESPLLTLDKASQIMLEDGHSVLLITDEENKLIGTLSESDFVGKEVNIPRALTSLKNVFGHSFKEKNISDIYLSSKGKEVGDILNSSYVSVDENTSFDKIADIMFNKRVDNVIVTKDDMPIGVINYRSLMQVFQSITRH